MPAGFLDLDVRYRDAQSGDGVAVESLVGYVRNSLGEAVDLVLPVAETDAGGVIYYARDYDVRDATKFPGLFLTVEWVAVRYGVALPTFSKQYDYAPVAKRAMLATVLEWAPCEDPRTLFYEVYRKLNSTDPVLIGRSFGPFFLDTTAYTNEFEARAWIYHITPVFLTPGEIQPDGSDYMASGTNINPERAWRTSDPVCEISGRLSDLIGGPGVDIYQEKQFPEVVFSIHPRATQQLVGSKYILPEDVYARVGADGSFTIVLLQDTIVEFRVNTTYFRARFVVPKTWRAELGDLDIEILRDY